MAKKKQNRLAPDLRKRQIIDAGLELVQSKGYAGLTARGVAAAVGVTHSAIFHHFPTTEQLQRAVMRTAIAREDLIVLGCGLAEGDKYAQRAPAGLQNRARQAIGESQPWLEK